MTFICPQWNAQLGSFKVARSSLNYRSSLAHRIRQLLSYSSHEIEKCSTLGETSEQAASIWKGTIGMLGMDCFQVFQVWKLQIELLALFWYIKTTALAVRSNLHCLEIELLEIKLRRFYVFLRLSLQTWRTRQGRRPGRDGCLTSKGQGEQERPEGGSQGQAQPWDG